MVEQTKPSLRSYYAAVLRNGRRQAFHILARWLPLELALTLGPVGVFAALVLPSWPFPHPTDEAATIAFAAVSAGILLIAVTILTFLWALAWAPVNLDQNQIAALSAATSERDSARGQVSATGDLEQARKERDTILASLIDEGTELLGMRNETGYDAVREQRFYADANRWEGRCEYELASLFSASEAASFRSEGASQPPTGRGDVADRCNSVWHKLDFLKTMRV